jgi:pimeloyl-ACP methyl ester carboxylesterase
MVSASPQIHSLPLQYQNRPFQIEYFHRPGTKGQILLVHGLGGAKENYWEACKSPALRDYSLYAFDNPGTGNSTFYHDMPLEVDDLAAITSLFIEALGLQDFILTGTSMGGLTTLLYLRNNGFANVKAYINIEGNLMPEDCMFSSKVVQFGKAEFINEVFPQTVVDMKKRGNAGYHIIANNLELNTDPTAYYHYSFQTVQYSADGGLLQQYLALPIPKIFIYGSANRGLSYLPQLLAAGTPVAEIPESDHFVFYDNPAALYRTIGAFADDVKN